MKLKNKKYFFFLLGLALIDFILFQASFLLIYFIRFSWFVPVRNFVLPSFFSAVYWKGLYSFPVYFRLSFVFSFVLLFVFYYQGLYKVRRGGEQLDEIFHIFRAVFWGSLVMISATFLIKEIEYSRFVVYLAGPLAFLTVSFWRSMLWAFVGWMYKRGHGINHTLIYGAGSAGRLILKEINEHGEFGLRVFGFIDDDPAKQGLIIDGVPVLGQGADILKIAEEKKIDEVILAFPSAERKKISELILKFQNTRINLKIMPDLYDIITSRVSTEKVGNIPVLEVLPDPLTGWKGWLKRALDIFGAIFGLILLSPMFLIIAIIIKLTSKGPVFFVQKRVGKDGKLFSLYKFRTMKVGADQEKEKLLALNEASGPLFKIKDDPRLTKVGKFLRRFSLDEYPQLLNVLLGQMSLVGPRPPVPEEVEKYNEWEKKRLSVRPGITGMWQVRGRSLLPFDEMVKLDIYYIENWSLWLDIKILLKTFWPVVTGRGAF